MSQSLLLSSRHGLPRSSLACLSCREAKAKCDGIIPASLALGAEPCDNKARDSVAAREPCSRCARLSLDCLWTACRRTGRPPMKRRRADDCPAGDQRTLTDVIHRNVGDPEPPQNFADQELVPGELCGAAEISGSSDSHSPTRDGSAMALGAQPGHGDHLPAFTGFDDVALSDASIQSLLEGLEGTSSATTAAPESLELQDVWTDASESARDAPRETEYQSEHSFALNPNQSPAAIAPTKPSSAASSAQQPASRSSMVEQFTQLCQRMRLRNTRAEPVCPRADTTSYSWTQDCTSLSAAGSCTAIGVRRFFDSVGKALPLYANLDDFWQRAAACPVQVYAAATLGHAMFEGQSGQSTVAMRAQSIQRAASADFCSALRSSIHGYFAYVSSIAALILMVYADYAYADEELLGEHLNAARLAAIRMQMHRMDTVESPHASERSFGTACADTCRRVWWELWALDAVIDVLTSGKFARRLHKTPLCVDYPRDDCPTFEASQSYSVSHDATKTLYRLRFEAINLLHNTVAAVSHDLRWVKATDTIHANLIAETQQTLLTATRSKRSEGAASRAHLDDNPEPSRAHRVILLDILLMLHVSRINLHRLYWLPDLTLDLRSCGLEQRLTAEKVLNASLDASRADNLAHVEEGSLRASTETILASADAICTLTRRDTEAFFNRMLHSFHILEEHAKSGSECTPLAPCAPPHWPFNGCCQMMASYGLFIGIAAGDAASHNEHNASHRPSHDDATSLRLSEGASSVSSSFSSQQSLLTKKSISSIGLMEASLGLLADIWPVAQSYRAQVHACRIALDLESDDLNR